MVNATFRFEDLARQLSVLELDKDVMEALEEAGGALLNATLDDLQKLKGVGPATAYGVFTIVDRFKARAGVTDSESASTRIPKEPPYLNGNPDNYDPTNAGQYWVDPRDAGVMWRWDGKRESLHPYGEVHRVVIVPHETVTVGRDDIRVPVRPERQSDEVRGLVAAGAHWFHQGYGCWIGQGGKPLMDVDPAIRRMVKMASEQVNQRAMVA